MKKLLVFAGVLALAWAGINAYFWTQKTDLAYCVVAADQSAFTGEWMKHQSAESERIIKAAECQNTDAALDNGDGKKAGRVRWVECMAGPDCNEGGNF